MSNASGNTSQSRAGASAARHGVNNRSSFQASKDKDRQKETTLAHAARNGVMGSSSTFKNSATAATAATSSKFPEPSSSLDSSPIFDV